MLQNEYHLCETEKVSSSTDPSGTPVATPIATNS